MWLGSERVPKIITYKHAHRVDDRDPPNHSCLTAVRPTRTLLNTAINLAGCKSSQTYILSNAAPQSPLLQNDFGRSQWQCHFLSLSAPWQFILLCTVQAHRAQNGIQTLAMFLYSLSFLSASRLSRVMSNCIRTGYNSSMIS